MSTLTPRETGRTGIMRACIDLLTAERVWWTRMNVGAMRYGKNRLMRWGRPGMADVFALLAIECDAVDNALLRLATGTAARVFQPIWIETKAPRGKQTKEQREFQCEVEAEGHTYLLIDDPTQLQTWLKEHR